MSPFAIIALGSSVFSAFSQIQAGKAARAAAELNAYNLETERELGKAEAVDNNNRRMELYNSNLSASIAAFSTMGRDIGQDRSVKAFLQKQKEIVGKDVSAIDTMEYMQALKTTAQAAAVRTEGRAQQRSAMVGAFTTLAQGLYQFNQVRMPSSTTSSSLAPSTSLRPRARPAG
jgi:hypothetical protein